MSDNPATCFSALRCVISSKIQFVRALDTPTRLVLLLFAGLIAIGHSGITKFGDDLYFAAQNSVFFSVWKMRFLEWTSRMLIDIVLVPFARLPLIVFYGVNTLIVLSLPFLLARLVARRGEMEKLIFPATCFVLMYPFVHMGGAGWIATCVNYLWPLVAALLAVLPLRKLYDGLPVSTDEYVFSAVCMLFACNNELLCASFLILVPAYAWSMGRSCPRILWVYAAIVAASLAVIVFCPGNASRLVKEVFTWMPQFFAMSLLQKLYYGYMSLIVPFLFHINFILLGLSAVLCIGVFQKYTALPVRISAMLPLFAHLLAAPEVILEPALFPDHFSQYGYFFLSFFMLASLALSLYLLADTLRGFVFVLAVLAAAFCARGGLAFSPTVFASGERTALYVYVALCIAGLWAYERLQDSPLGTLTLCKFVFVALALLSYV